MKLMIDQFTFFDLFGHDNYEFYARVTGRILRVQGEWICSFRYPAPSRGISKKKIFFFFFFGIDRIHLFYFF